MALLVIAAAIYLIKKKGGLVFLISSEDQTSRECKIGDKRDCEFVRFFITVGERPPGLDESIEASLNEIDYYSYALEFTPTKGTTVAPKFLHEFVETLTRIHNRMRELNIKGHGVNVYGVVRWQECQEQGFWLWKHNDWIIIEKNVRIDAPAGYVYQISRSHSWKPELILDPQHYFVKENVTKIVDHVKKEALKECPCNVKTKDKKEI